jgi:hypothetical protein
VRAYIADTNNESNDSFVHVVEVPSGRRAAMLNAAYCPTVAVSPSGSRIFVVSTRIDGGHQQNHVEVFDGRSYKQTARWEFDDRFLYNVAPSGPELIVSDSGDECFLARCRFIGDAQCEYAITRLAVRGDTMRPIANTSLPMAIAAFGQLPRRANSLFVSVSGEEGEAIGIAELRSKRSAGFTSMMTAGNVLVTNRHPDIPFFPVAGGADLAGNAIVYVSRQGDVRIHDVRSGALSEPIRLLLPGGMEVPFQELLVVEGGFYLGLADRELAARGQIDLVYEYRFAQGSLLRQRAFAVPPQTEKMLLSPNRRELVTLSRLERHLGSFDLQTLAVTSRVQRAGITPVQLAVSE